MRLDIIRKQLKKNKGMSLVTVIIVIAFVGIMASIILATSLVNFKMKSVNERGTDTFYSAERVLDEINIGLQGTVSKCLSEAYTDVMSNYAAYSDDQKNERLQTMYYERIWGELCGMPGDPGYDPSHSKFLVSTLESYLKDSTKWSGGPGYNPSADENLDRGYGAIITTFDASGTENGNSGVLISYKNTGIVLKDVKVYYKDPSGFVSIIKTDIRLGFPNFTFSKNSTLPDIPNYCFIADEGAEINSVKMDIDGNIYANYLRNHTKNSQITIGKDDSVPRTVTIKYDIDLKDSELTTTKGTVIWAKNIIAESTPKTEIDAKAYIQNDLNIKGKNSKVVLKGEYSGYSNDVTNANNSSAILINGINSQIDFSGLEALHVAGRAFIGLKKDKDNIGVLTGTPTEEDEKKKEDVYTGESVSVKPDQLVYLVPGEAIGVDKKTLRSRYNANPLTEEQYNYINSNLNTYDEVSVETDVSDVGGTLADYIKVKNDPSPGILPRVVGDAQKIFVKTADGKGRLVYYYMTFKDEAAADNYFAKNYANNKQSIDNYNKYYVKSISYPLMSSMIRYDIAGNSIIEDKEEKGSLSLQHSTLLSQDHGTNVYDNERKLYFGRFSALTTKLIMEEDELTSCVPSKFEDTLADEDKAIADGKSKDEYQVVFENIVGEEKLKEYVGEAINAAAEGTGELVETTGTAVNVGGKYVATNNASLLFKNGDDKALIKIGDVTIGEADKDIHFVIATGNVVINASNYKGTIICNGKVKTGSNQMSVSPSTVRQAMQYRYEIAGINYPIASAFKDGMNYIYASATKDNDPRYMTLSGLVSYENWKKE